MLTNEKRTNESKILFMPVERMWRRVDIAKSESDTTYFHDLTYFGEMLGKLAVAAVLAMIDDDRERTRYRHVHTLVRANGLGDCGARFKQRALPESECPACTEVWRQ